MWTEWNGILWDISDLFWGLSHHNLLAWKAIPSFFIAGVTGI